jgi:glycerol uptake facilitator-like aquaporin
MSSDLKEKIKDNYNDKNKLRFFAYEFIGTAIVTFGANMGANLYLVVLWLCWEVSAAHFNMALSLGSLMLTVSDKDWTKHLTNYIFIALVQFAGAMAGTFITFIAVIATYTASSYVDAQGNTVDYNAKDYAPATPKWCPSQLATDGDACGQQGIDWEVFSNEFITSFLFIFVFLIIRNYKLTGDSSKWHAFGKAFLVF